MSENVINICWRAPSNIALIKYWGKRLGQLPENCSLSISLEKSTTTTSLSFCKKKPSEGEIHFEYYFHDQRIAAFEKKIGKVLNDLGSELPFLNDYKLIFHSENNFPHSAGIASSASSMSALALCLVSMEEIVNQKILNPDEFYRRASFIARLGSGSASRSVYGGFVTWGKYFAIVESSDDYATPLIIGKDSRLNLLRDIILIVDSDEKPVSSTSGHALMTLHPYREGRKQQVNSNLDKMISAISNKDYKTIGIIAENEALSLHALLMTSSTEGLLLKPSTLHIIEEIKKFRKATTLDVFFTIDAGPNVHLIYFEDQRAVVLEFVRKNLLQYCEERRWIDDKMGTGPVQLNQKN